MVNNGSIGLYGGSLVSNNPIKGSGTIKAVAQVTTGGKTAYYSDFEFAVNEAHKVIGRTAIIKLLTDVKLIDYWILFGGTFTLDLNGHNISGNSHIIKNSGILNLTDTSGKSGTISSTGDCNVIYNYGTMTMEKVTISGASTDKASGLINESSKGTNPTFTMYSGKIAVKASKGSTFIMNGGMLDGTTAGFQNQNDDKFIFNAGTVIGGTNAFQKLIAAGTYETWTGYTLGTNSEYVKKSPTEVVVGPKTPPVVTPTPSSSSSPSSISTPAPEPKIGGTTGWTNLEEKILKAKTGETVTVDMNGTTNVPQSILSDIKGKDVTAKLDFGTYSWEINGKDITTAQSVDLGVTYAPNVISSDVVGGVAGNSPFIQLQLNYNGSFGFTGKLTVHLPAEMAGQYANLYYYNPKTKKLELYASALIGKDGKATFNFSHASDYVVVMEKTSKSSNLAEGESVADNAEPIVQSGMPYAVIAFVLAVGIIAFKQRKAKK